MERPLADTITERDIPAAFWPVPYDPANSPREGEVPDITGGANCQVFAYALLRHFGRIAPQLRSSELWADTAHTARIEENFEPLDLLLFNPTAEAFGAHVAVSLGGDRAIHLSQRVGRPVIWPLARFHEEPEYRVLLGGKRVVAHASDE